jgi:hypothetical protein
LSDGISNTMRICMADLEKSVKPEMSLEDRLRAAMSATRGHWLVTNEDEQFRCAVGAVMLSYGPDAPEFDRLSWEMEGIRKVSAMITAASAGLSVNLSEDDFNTKQYEPIGLIAMWKERQ